MVFLNSVGSIVEAVVNSFVDETQRIKNECRYARSLTDSQLVNKLKNATNDEDKQHYVLALKERGYSNKELAEYI